MPDPSKDAAATAAPSKKASTLESRAAQALSSEQRAALFAGVPNEPGAPKPDATMVVDGVSRTFGGLKAVDVAHLEIQRGCITGLIGPNGAGKTTLFNLLTGFDRPDTGTWSMDGQELGRMHPHQVARKGVVRTFQLTKALSKLTVLDNVRLGATGQRGERMINTFMPWTWKADDLAGSLSGGQRKLLEMARALMTDPSVVMLDEPMAGVNPALTQSLLGHIKSLRDDGMTVVFVEHDMDVIRDISDWVVVMAQGSIIAESTPEELSNNGAVVDAYLGSHHDQALEFDADGNPVGATAELAEALKQAEKEELEAGGDLSEPEFVSPVTPDVAEGGSHRAKEDN
jgi:neutral amino acid transport system ATP-binding protein